MASAKAILLAIFVLSSMTALGLQNDDLSADNQTPEISVEHWYALKTNALITVMEDSAASPNENVGGQEFLNLSAGTELSVLAIDGLNNIAQIGINEDINQDNPGIDGKNPVIAYVQLSDLVRAGVREIDTRGIEQLMQPSNDDTDSEFAPTEVAGRAHIRRSGGHHKGMTYCLADVFFAAHRFTCKVPAGIPYAALAYPRYRAEGWRPTAYSASVPAGTACFFSGGDHHCGRGACGHASIKIGPNAWKGAGIRPTPFLPNHRLQGCLIPPRCR